jgi:hypothetical protein
MVSRAAAVAALVMGVFVSAGCAPDAPPETWIFTEQCHEATSPGIGFVFHGPINSLNNATAYPNGDGRCLGDEYRLANLVRADSADAAVATCETVLGIEWMVDGVEPLTLHHDTLPSDGWFCLYGPLPSG